MDLHPHQPSPVTLPVAAAAPPAAPNDPLIALASAIERGALPDGLSYYVMKHKKPEPRAAPWLAVNAGSVLARFADDHQRATEREGGP